jgi:hypothetical protein
MSVYIAKVKKLWVWGLKFLSIHKLQKGHNGARGPLFATPDLFKG